jgi:hypothetical protein
VENSIILFVSILISLIFIYFFIRDIFSIKNKKVKEYEIKRDILLKNKPSVPKTTIQSFSPISTSLLENNKSKLNEVSFEIKKIIDNGYENPSNLEELEEFFISNMTYGNKTDNEIKDFLIILLNKIVENNTPRDNHFIGRLFDDLINLNYTDFSVLLQHIKNEGSKELKLVTIEYFISKQKYNAKHNYFKIILETFNSEDDYIFKNLADFYANQFKENKSKTLEIFDNIFPDLKITSLKRKQNSNFFAFLSEFSVKLFIDSNGNLDNLTVYVKFLYNKYSLLKSLFENDSKNPIKSSIKKSLYLALESSGINQWEKAIGNLETNRAINNKFFIKAKGEHEELIQRDELLSYYKYLIQIHNDQFEEINLGNQDDFFLKTIRCINFHEYSVIGYIATLALLSLLLKDEDKFSNRLNSVLDVLLKQETNSSKFYLFIFCDGLLKVNKLSPENSKELISLFKDKIIPLKFKEYPKINTFFFLDNSSLPLIENRKYYYEILDNLLSTKLFKNNYEALKTDAIQTCFLSNIEIGKFLAQYFIDSNIFKTSNGKQLVINILGALYFRDKIFVTEFLKLIESSQNIYISEWDIINNIETCHEKIRDARSYQTNWNQLLIQAFVNDKKLRFYIIKDLLGGLTQSNCVEDFSKEFRRFIIEVAKGYLFDEYPCDIILTEEIAFNSTESKYKKNGGLEYKMN